MADAASPFGVLTGGFMEDNTVKCISSTRGLPALSTASIVKLFWPGCVKVMVCPLITGLPFNVAFTNAIPDSVSMASKTNVAALFCIVSMENVGSVMWGGVTSALDDAERIAVRGTIVSNVPLPSLSSLSSAGGALLA